MQKTASKEFLKHVRICGVRSGLPCARKGCLCSRNSISKLARKRSQKVPDPTRQSQTPFAIRVTPHAIALLAPPKDQLARAKPPADDADLLTRQRQGTRRARPAGIRQNEERLTALRKNALRISSGVSVRAICSAQPRARKGYLCSKSSTSKLVRNHQRAAPAPM